MILSDEQKAQAPAFIAVVDLVERTRILAIGARQSAVWAADHVRRDAQGAVSWDTYRQASETTERLRQEAKDHVASKVDGMARAQSAQKLLAGAAAARQIGRELPYMITAAMIELTGLAAQLEREAREQVEC